MGEDDKDKDIQEASGLKKGTNIVVLVSGGAIFEHVVALSAGFAGDAGRFPGFECLSGRKVVNR
jgi:hypothetical protein